MEEDDRPELEWWKCKKWALRILERFIYRYGKPGNTEKQYRQFAQYYAKTFNGMRRIIMERCPLSGGCIWPLSGGCIWPLALRVGKVLCSLTDTNSLPLACKMHYMRDRVSYCVCGGEAP